MYRFCHRCHAELPERGGDAERTLFCPECGAPQLTLPDWMRTEIAPAEVGRTTGAVPPPRPQLVDWAAALSSALPVALASGLLAVVSWAVPAATLLNTLCVLGGAGITLALYHARRPAARIDGRVGLRVGLLTGLLIVTASGIGMSASGTLERFALHGLVSFDAQISQQLAASRAQVAEQLHAQAEPAGVEEHVLGWMSAPEVRAGVVLLSLGHDGGADPDLFQRGREPSRACCRPAAAGSTGWSEPGADAEVSAAIIHNGRAEQ